MVSRLALILALVFAPAAQSADWSRSGGPLFATPKPPVAEVGETASIAERAVPMPPGADQPLDAEVRKAAADNGLDPKLLHALITVESAYRADAVSPAGAAGLTQLMPATAAELGVTDRFDSAQNISAGAAYLARQMSRFSDVRLALAAYNAGPRRVARLGRTPDIGETQAYVRSVVDCYLALTAGRPIRNAADCRSAGAGR